MWPAQKMWYIFICLHVIFLQYVQLLIVQNIGEKDHIRLEDRGSSNVINEHNEHILTWKTNKTCNFYKGVYTFA